MTVVDVHCHTFNGDDLPVRGFVQRVLLENIGALSLVSWVLDNVGQLGTPGYEEERAQLDRLLGYEDASLAASVYIGEPTFDAAVQAAFEQVSRENPKLLVDAERDLVSSLQGAPPGPEAFSFVDGFGAARRAIAWAVLLRRSRLDITRQLVSTYPEVDLFVPMTVDMAVGLHDTPKVSPLQQLELQEKISRLSMLGRLAPGANAHVHPFIGFDPRSELRSRAAHDVITALEVVRMAIEKFGFVGVKLYPPMGFRPVANEAGPEMTAAQATAVDGILEELYSWCEAEHVPITVHCNASNAAYRDYRTFSDPVLWGEVLDNHADLHLNLGHFGGARAKDDPNDPGTPWPDQIAALAKGHLRLFADSGDHRIDDRTIADAYMARLQAMFAAGTPTAAMAPRFMYGSDWYMLALLPNWPEFLHEYRAHYTETFGEPAAARFMGDAALEFLGINPANANGERLRQRYANVGVLAPGWLS
jgi:predicted TIM-barrel fold metal-dependent hydrolase